MTLDAPAFSFVRTIRRCGGTGPAGGAPTQWVGWLPTAFWPNAIALGRTPPALVYGLCAAYPTRGRLRRVLYVAQADWTQRSRHCSGNPSAGCAAVILAESVALVTGASRGIGAATAIALAQLGAHVVITARTQGGLEDTDDAIRAAGGAATLLPMDLAEREQIDAIGPSLYQRFGRLDVLVPSAGALGRLTPVAHITPNDWADVVAVNLAAAWRLIRELRSAAAQRAGRSRGVRHRCAGAGAAGLLGRVRRDQGRHAAPRADLGGRTAQDAAAGEPVRSRRGAVAAAVERVSRRGSGDAAATRGRGAGAGGVVPARRATAR